MPDRDKLVSGLEKRAPEFLRVITQVYNDDVTGRLVRLLRHFAERFPERRQVSVLRAPGRVNLIGEHTDYNGLPVLPMAIDHDMLVAFSPREDLEVRVTNPEFPDRSFRIEEKIPSFETGDWGNYVKAGVQGIVDEIGGAEGLRGFDACYFGDVPVGAGLSSSSTLVVASAMAVIGSSGLELEPLALAERMAQAEWYVGTQGGGMDHAVCILSEKGKALKIDFFPLRVKPVGIPAGYTIVIANSMVIADKTKNARMKYNRRPAECKAATAMLVKKLGLDKEKILRLGDIYFLLGRERTRAALEETFTQHRYFKTEIAEFLGISLLEVNSGIFTTKAGDLIEEPADGTRIGDRARHIVSEAARVEDSVKAVEAGDGETFGRLMNESHESCRGLYKISHPALDELVAVAREAGSAGSRLTGAGYGGCTVHLVPDSKVEHVLSSLKSRYFGDAINHYPEAAERYRRIPERTLLALRPSGGARVLF
ncbi:MAG TPA: galactokinase [archaeon]|nr:galactokinase [archaeon]